MFVLDIPTLLLYYMDHRCGVRARVGRRRACALTWLPPGSKSDPRAPVPRPVCKCKVHVVGNLRLYNYISVDCAPYYKYGFKVVYWV